MKSNNINHTNNKKYFEAGLTRQNEILEKVFATNSYEEGAGVLKSDESVKLIQEESLLLEKYYLESR